VDIRQRRASSLFATSLILCLVGLCLLTALVNRAYHLTVLCLLVFAVTAGLRLWAKSSASRMKWRLQAGKARVFPGESITMALAAENRSFFPLSFEAYVPISDGLGGQSGIEPLQAENSLLWFQSLHVEWVLAALRRGVHTVGPVNVATGDLLGFFVEENTWREQIEVIVYPRLIPLQPLSLPKRDFFGIPGGESPVDDPVYILGTIDYHHGRPARHIHWKASARHGRLQQKVFEPTEQEKVLLVVDVDGFSGQESEAAFEEMLEVVASLAARIDRQGSAIGLFTNAQVTKGSPIVPVTRNRFQITAILETLARMQMRQGFLISEVLQRGPALPWGTTCIYFALSASDNTNRGRALFARRRTPLVFLTYPDIRELREERSGGPTQEVPTDHSTRRVMSR
jgi:uncharacterized protein (DUF58 family)